ncbi:Allergen V5/Tpx-1 family protein [Verminephrobacter eiseniae EF01-2]|uniref:Allergen V5/Tpx-1 family protein n=1 Tax=Verminephrobacter eiseniae (strain EF01-2) TaxID=391735 RepID=A1WP32_VEREI|nr:CAP domain-containing protein [Verminephrobacter eiseniae]ABM59389.1 Allergen V5/Tpx-1 family protein [Verminephrobacter eiseniae EF01-2]MCW5284915.1 CAP domain-containing protein [Verminephrobacter eiseniae]MCW8192278.1 CAP domain-containing protein [Verminephrobacter eiseniae]
MKNIKITLVMTATAAMLAACGGGGSDTPAVVTPAPDTPAVVTPAVTADTLNRTNTPGVYADNERKYMFDMLNQVRGITGVGFLKQNEALDKAAQAHAEYRWMNPGESGHTEKIDYAGFTGETPADRARHFGYAGYASESVVGSITAMGAINRLLGGPYHARHLLWDDNDLGTGRVSSGLHTVVTGTNSWNDRQKLAGDQIAMYPCNNIQVNVQGQGYETPTPAVLNGKDDFGYSSMAIVRRGQTLVVDAWELRDAAGNLVPTVVMTGANDTLKYFSNHEAALIPLNALPRTVTTYTSVLKGKNNGVPFEKTCTWRTVAGETVPSN